VAALLAIARTNPSLRAVTAVTAVDNLPSQAVLIANGFGETGRETRDDDGEVILWRLNLNSRHCASAPAVFPS
jgi:RimJ/RimL family protein N-acetyltransferase